MGLRYSSLTLINVASLNREYSPRLCTYIFVHATLALSVPCTCKYRGLNRDHQGTETSKKTRKIRYQKNSKDMIKNYSIRKMFDDQVLYEATLTVVVV